MNNSSLEKIDFIIRHLEHFSNREALYNYWIKGKGPGYVEDTLTWSDGYPYFKQLVRTKEITLTKDQVRAIMKIDVMINTLDRALMKSHAPEDYCEYHLYILNHPYCTKLIQQAKYALSLLTK